MSADSQTLDLSVVVAAQRPSARLEACLGSLRAQVVAAGLEVIVAEASSQESWARLRERFPEVRLVKLPAGTGVPGLWHAGISTSRGKIVALTIEQCVPAANWAAEILRAHAANDAAAIGGAIEKTPEAGLADWAVYFSRYSRYIPPLAPEFRDDLAGDNCSYKRAALEASHEAMAEGFWETFVHQAMRAHGARLLCDPALVVRYAGDIGLGAFARRRFADGRYFAARRARKMGAAGRFLRAAAFPVTAALLFARIAARVWKNGRYRGRLLLVSPLVLTFLLSWALGECAGYLFGPSDRPQPAAEKHTAVDSLG
jgi:GT2 family glycosyltransferase